MGLVSLQLDIPEMIDIHRRPFLKRNGRGGVDKVGGEGRLGRATGEKEGGEIAIMLQKHTISVCVCVIVY